MQKLKWLQFCVMGELHCSRVKGVRIKQSPKCGSSVELLVQKVILPKLVCHWFTRDHLPNNSLSQPLATTATNSLTSSDTHKCLSATWSQWRLKAEQIPASADLEATGPVVSAKASEVTTNLYSSIVFRDQLEFTVRYMVVLLQMQWRLWFYDCMRPGCKIEWYYLLCVNVQKMRSHGIVLLIWTKRINVRLHMY